MTTGNKSPDGADFGALNFDFIDQLYADDPYEGFDHSAYQMDLQGWNGRHPIFEEIISHVRPSLIIEVGTWKGQSALHMAEVLKKVGVQCKILCVDTWLGNIEHWNIKRSDRIYDSLSIKNGYPQLFYQFLANVMHCGQSDVIIPFPQTSTSAARWLCNAGIKADIIHIDASQEYNDVVMDLKAWAPIIADQGVLIGDDYPWEGVQRAAHEFATERNLEIYVDNPKWVVSKRLMNI